MINCTILTSYDEAIMHLYADERATVRCALRGEAGFVLAMHCIACIGIDAVYSIMSKVF